LKTAAEPEARKVPINEAIATAKLGRPFCAIKSAGTTVTTTSMEMVGFIIW
jgi:hypothetical protein